jgi:hypothetical protein
MSTNGTPVMELREEPKFVQFSTGDVIEGNLFAMERIRVKEKLAIRYTVQEESGAMLAFIGTHQLNAKLRPTDLAHRVEIRCIGEDTMVKRGDNCMKVFEVRVSKDPVIRGAAIDSTEITDDDIHF